MLLTPTIIRTIQSQIDSRGGDRIKYPDDASSPAASLLESKLLFIITILYSRQGAIFMSYYLKEFFLETPMSRAEYMKTHSKYFPTDIRDQYQMDGLISEDGYFYIKIIKGMYGLKQASRIAYNQLISHMDPHGYYPVPFTTVLWAHKTRKTKSCLCVGDFGVKCFTKDDANHLLYSLKKHYVISTDWERLNYLGLEIDFKYS